LRALPGFGCCLGLAAFAIVLSSCGGGGTSSGPPAPKLTITTASIPDALINQPYSARLQATGGSGSLIWSTSAPLPTGLTLDSSGTVSGTPTSVGSFGIVAQVRDSGNPQQVVTATVAIIIVDIMRILTSTVPDANRNEPYISDIIVFGGKGPYQTTFTNGALPPGLTIGPNPGSGSALRVSGTPTQAGTFPFTLLVTDTFSTPQTASVDLTLTVTNLLRITSIQLKSGVQGRPYSDTITFVNGTAPFTWSSPDLPTGLTISNTGAISGTPTQATNFVTITVKDSSSPVQSDTRFFQMTIFGTLKFTGSSLPDAIVNQPYGASMPVTGGVPPVDSSLVSGSLPPGLQLASTFVAGTPTTVGNYSFTVQVQDGATPPQLAQQTLTLNVLPQPPSVQSTRLPRGIVGRPYSWGLGALHGVPPLHWSLISSTLPPGLTLDPRGLISGTPTTAGRFTFTVQVADSIPRAQNSSRILVIDIGAHAMGRNDSIATATPITNGSFIASISPFADPSSGTPDSDYYKITANPGAIVSVNALASIFQTSTLDPVIEIVDGTGARFNTCSDPGNDGVRSPLTADPTVGAFDDSCINDDISLGLFTDSSLAFQVPGATGGAPVTFYLHVLDFRGDARPDMVYQINLSGAN
jgi:putative Ig domain-containing protein